MTHWDLPAETRLVRLRSSVQFAGETDPAAKPPGSPRPQSNRSGPERRSRGRGARSTGCTTPGCPVADDQPTHRDAPTSNAASLICPIVGGGWAKRQQRSGTALDPPLASRPLGVCALGLSTIEFAEAQLVRHILNELLLQPPQHLPGHSAPPAQQSSNARATFASVSRCVRRGPNAHGPPIVRRELGGFPRSLLISPEPRNARSTESASAPPCPAEPEGIASRNRYEPLGASAATKRTSVNTGPPIVTAVGVVGMIAGIVPLVDLFGRVNSLAGLTRQRVRCCDPRFRQS
jgi:hypothetical protein